MTSKLSRIATKRCTNPSASLAAQVMCCRLAHEKHARAEAVAQLEQLKSRRDALAAIAAQRWNFLGCLQVRAAPATACISAVASRRLLWCGQFIAPLDLCCSATACFCILAIRGLIWCDQYWLH